MDFNFMEKPLHKPGKKKSIPSLKLLATSLKVQLKEFFNNSTLHGVRYIAEPGRPFAERFMWFCLVSIGIVAAFVIIANLWQKFLTNPTITGLDTDLENVQIFFPSVLICPEKPFDNDRIEELIKQMDSVVEPELIIPLLEILTRLSYESMDEAYEATKNISDTTPFELENLRHWVFSVHVQCHKFFSTCKFKGEIFDCCDAFYPVYSERGFCFGFNARAKDGKDTEEFNVKLSDLVETDKKWSLAFEGQIKSFIYLFSYEESMGYDFHPDVLWDPVNHVEVSISMKRTYTTEDARQLSVKQRKCLFFDEMQFQYYPHDKYTFTGCMRECRIKKSLQFCKCLPPFYHPNVTFRPCSLVDMECLARRAADITDIRDCDHCELSCDQTVYVIEKIAFSIRTALDKEMDLQVNIEFLTWPIVQYKREVLFGWVDLLVSFGGIAGLFLGFSLLSGVEIVYYFTMRTLCMLYKNKDELYAIEKKTLLRPPIKYDLSLKLKVNQRQQIGEPPALHIISEHPVIHDRPNDRIKRFGKFHQSNQKLTIIGRKNMFKAVSVAPYSRNIKPLDGKFKQDLDDSVFLGYIP